MGGTEQQTIPNHHHHHRPLLATSQKQHMPNNRVPSANWRPKQHRATPRGRAGATAKPHDTPTAQGACPPCYLGFVVHRPDTATLQEEDDDQEGAHERDGDADEPHD